MNVNFESIWIIYICLILAFLFFISDYIHIQPKRKIRLANRRKKKDSIIFSRIKSIILGLFRGNEKYESFIDIVQFNIGYKSESSEDKNRNKAENFFIYKVILNLSLVIILLIHKQTSILMDLITILFAFIIQYIKYNGSVQIKKRKLRGEFPIFLNEYISAYVITRNIRESFIKASDELSPTYQVAINRLVTQLIANGSPTKAFMQFDKRVDYPLCSCFISIVETSYISNRNIIENLLELQGIIGKDIAREKDTKDKLGDKNANISLFIFLNVVEILGVGSILSTSTGNFFLTTAQGQQLLFITIAFIIISLICMAVADRL
ncbi:MAG: hypothetical protein ACLS2V_13010 [Clostridium paraputrificum]|uniref:hypothetical protein n=1 Tax=Clostridium sp. TaxID=1506 RepID=UPI0025BE6E19|nr:hypothetical protein [Clostridium sp.]MBS5926211.1 hypothetical protein [Clostridium sp.]